MQGTLGFLQGSFLLLPLFCAVLLSLFRSPLLVAVASAVCSPSLTAHSVSGFCMHQIPDPSSPSPANTKVLF